MCIFLPGMWTITLFCGIMVHEVIKLFLLNGLRRFAGDYEMYFSEFIIVLLFNLLVALVLVFIDYFGILGDAKDRKSCTNREWWKGSKGFINTVTWEGIRKFVPKYLYVFHIITLSVIVLGLVTPLTLLFGVLSITGFASLSMMSWLYFLVCYSSLLSFWEQAVSPKNNLFVSVVSAISTLIPIALMIIFLYKLIRGMLS